MAIELYPGTISLRQAILKLESDERNGEVPEGALDSEKLLIRAMLARDEVFRLGYTSEYLIYAAGVSEANSQTSGLRDYFCVNRALIEAAREVENVLGGGDFIDPNVFESSNGLLRSIRTNFEANGIVSLVGSLLPLIQSDRECRRVLYKELYKKACKADYYVLDLREAYGNLEPLEI
jgi:hypothetical protein